MEGEIDTEQFMGEIRKYDRFVQSLWQRIQRQVQED